MSRKARLPVLLAIAAVLITSLSLTALAATEEGEEGGDTGATTTTIASGLHAAVDAGTEETAPALPDWTYRYMVPTGLGLAAIIILITAIKYFTDVVRKRYRIVE